MSSHTWWKCTGWNWLVEQVLRPLSLSLSPLPLWSPGVSLLLPERGPLHVLLCQHQLKPPHTSFLLS